MDQRDAERIIAGSAKIAARHNRPDRNGAQLGKIIAADVLSSPPVMKALPRPGPDRMLLMERARRFEVRIDGDGYCELSEEGSKAWAEECQRKSIERDKQLQEQRTQGEQAVVMQRRRRLEEASMRPGRYQMAKLDDLRAVPEEYREKYARVADRLRGLIYFPQTIALVGGRGPGKTHISIGLINEFCANDKSALYLRAVEIFQRIRATYGGRGGPTEIGVIDALCRPDLLVIDEIQVRSGSDAEGQALTNLLDRRHAEPRATLIVGNLIPDDLKRSLGASIEDRIAEILVADWPSLRHLEFRSAAV